MSSAMEPDSVAPQQPRLLDKMRDKIRVKHYSIGTEQTYLDWVRRYIRFHGLRHPRELGAEAVEAFLTHLAVKRNVDRTRMTTTWTETDFRVVFGNTSIDYDGAKEEINRKKHGYSLESAAYFLRRLILPRYCQVRQVRDVMHRWTPALHQATGDIASLSRSSPIASGCTSASV